jgi:UDP-N-acetylglucosamine--N-acetylmuramyl-(pentapeptide) pyrophosphoryl-undecaprenol N-acetylglucosamine transferase
LERSIDVEPIKAIFAGGGTGGHLFPAIAIADEIRRIDSRAAILFVGTAKKLEARLVPEKGYAFRTIWISGFSRSLRPGNVLFPIKLVVAMMQARSIIREFRPDVVVGTGGYVSGPVLRSAAALGVPTLIQEQNSHPGVTTRLLAGKVNEVHLTFESSVKYFQRTDNLVVSGNPTRRDLEGVDRAEACRYFGFDPADGRTTLLVFGGSLGARSINEAVARALPELASRGHRVIWQTGSDWPLRTAEEPGSLWVSPFIDRMDYAYAASDLAVCRAGATTIAEITCLGKPAILVPYPRAAANHQVENARSMANAGAAELLYDHEVMQGLLPAVERLSDPQRLRLMGEQSRKLGRPGAAAAIARRAIALAESGRRD